MVSLEECRGPWYLGAGFRAGRATPGTHRGGGAVRREMAFAAVFWYSAGVESTLHSRLAHAVGNATYRHLADMTGANSETVRRYMNGCEPSAEFLTSICRATGVSGHWLLTGRGPVREQEMVREALRQAQTPELLRAMAETMQRLVERVECLERYVQQLDARVRVRAAHGAAGGEHHDARSSPTPTSAPTPTPAPGPPSAGESGGGPVSFAGRDGADRWSDAERARSTAG